MPSFAMVAAVLGWCGTLTLLFSYWLVSTKRALGDSMRYQLLNFWGSVGLGIAAAAGRVWSAVALNTIWCVIGVGVMIGAWRRRAASGTATPLSQPGSTP